MFNMSLVIEVLVFLIIGFIGYFSTLDQTEKIFVYRKRLTQGPDYLMLVGMVLLIINLFATLPISAFSGRQALCMLLFKTEFEGG